MAASAARGRRRPAFRLLRADPAGAGRAAAGEPLDRLAGIARPENPGDMAPVELVDEGARVRLALERADQQPVGAAVGRGPGIVAADQLRRLGADLAVLER